MLSCVVCYVIESFVCIDYLICQYEMLSVMCSDKIFDDRSYNEWIVIGITEVLMNCISCRGLMKDTNSNAILL